MRALLDVFILFPYQVYPTEWHATPCYLAYCFHTKYSTARGRTEFTSGGTASGLLDPACVQYGVWAMYVQVEGVAGPVNGNMKLI